MSYYILFCFIALIIGAIVVSKYLDIEDERKKRIINIIFLVLLFLCVIAIIILSSYFFHLLKG